jgi:glycine/D-amino acid oxidase-like deaminating enzyme
VDGRVLFGGGRNLDFEGETTDSFADNELILADLKHKLDTIILPQTPYEIDYHWSGIMAFGADKFPIIASHSERVYMAVRMGGMGVAIGSEAAYRLVRLMLS